MVTYRCDACGEVVPPQGTDHYLPGSSHYDPNPLIGDFCRGCSDRISNAGNRAREEAETRCLAEIRRENGR